MSDPIIKMVDIEKHFGSVIALAGVSFDVQCRGMSLPAWG